MSNHLVPQSTKDLDVSITAAYRTVFLTSVKRATALVEAETEALRNGRHKDLRAFEHRKSQALLDLSRAQASLPQLGSDAEVGEALTRLRVALSGNMGLLDHHMQALQEITDLLARSLLEADSDGTYSPRSAGRLGKPGPAGIPDLRHA